MTQAQGWAGNGEAEERDLRDSDRLLYAIGRVVRSSAFMVSVFERVAVLATENEHYFAENSLDDKPMGIQVAAVIKTLPRLHDRFPPPILVRVHRAVMAGQQLVWYRNRVVHDQWDIDHRGDGLMPITGRQPLRHSATSYRSRVSSFWLLDEAQFAVAAALSNTIPLLARIRDGLEPVEQNEFGRFAHWDSERADANLHRVFELIETGAEGRWLWHPTPEGKALKLPEP